MRKKFLFIFEKKVPSPIGSPPFDGFPTTLLCAKGPLSSFPSLFARMIVDIVPIIPCIGVFMDFLFLLPMFSYLY